MSPKFFPHARQVLEILRVHARIPLLAGCSSGGLIASAEEIESAGGFCARALFAAGRETERRFASRRSRSRKRTAKISGRWKPALSQSK